MRIEPYVEHIPEIERRIRLLEPDAIVMGLGPSSWLLPWIDQKLLEKPRRFGVHDIFRILPVDDLIIMDPPHAWLGEAGERFKQILDSRPKRWWFYPKAWTHPEREQVNGTPFWHKHLPQCLRRSVAMMDWEVIPPNEPPVMTLEDGRKVRSKDGYKLDADPPQTTSMSPCGATTLAWHLGCRRIGVIGLDCTMREHPSYQGIPGVTMFMKFMAMQAEQAGGAIWNLSPISNIRKFDPPDVSASSSVPILGSKLPVPKPSSSTQSASTRPVT